MNVVWLQQTEAQVPKGTEWLSPRERAHLSGLRFPKRRRDWRLGRWTAKRAVALYLGRDMPGDLADIEVRPTLSGAPEVFLAGQRADFSISLSHRQATAMAALAPSGGNIGCDLEWVEPHSQPFVADYFTPEEQALIRHSSLLDQAALVSLMWSAKESALKALHQGLRLDTRQLIVKFAGEAGTTWKSFHNGREQGVSPIRCALDGNWAQHDWRGFTVTLDGDRTLQGCWHQSANLVRTLIADADLLPPALLDCGD